MKRSELKQIIKEVIKEETSKKRLNESFSGYLSTFVEDSALEEMDKNVIAKLDKLFEKGDDIIDIIDEEGEFSIEGDKFFPLKSYQRDFIPYASYYTDYLLMLSNSAGSAVKSYKTAAKSIANGITSLLKK